MFLGKKRSKMDSNVLEVISEITHIDLVDETGNYKSILDIFQELAQWLENEE